MDQDIRSELDAGRYRAGFELLLARYQRKVFRLAYSIIGEEGPAEEVAQDVFLRVWKMLPSYRGEASLSTWIYVIARNRALTYGKKLREHRMAPLDEPRVMAAVESRPTPQPARAAAGDAEALLDQLPPPYRQALRLFYLEEKSYDQVSAMMGLPLGTVKTYLHRARKQLAASLVR